MISGLFLYFLPQIIDRIFAVMRPDPDLAQTGAKTRWIYRDLFDKTARIYNFPGAVKDRLCVPGLPFGG